MSPKNPQLFVSTHVTLELREKTLDEFSEKFYRENTAFWEGFQFQD